jgi:hypothetical protein
MADVTLTGFSVPSQPNFGLAVWNVDGIPEQFTDSADALATTFESPVEQAATVDTYQGPDAKMLVRVISEVVAPDGTTTLTLDAPAMLDAATITHGSALVDVTSLSVAGNAIIQGVRRFLRRISKLNRGAN